MLANNWLKPKSLPGGGYASTYATRVDKVEKKREGGKSQSDNSPLDSKEGKASRNRRKTFECFTCRDNHYASDFPHRKKLISTKQQQEGSDDGDAFVNAAWEANVL